MAKLRVPTPKYISHFLYGSHGLLIILAIGFSLCAFFTSHAERDSLQEFKLHITDHFVTSYYVTTFFLLFATGMGIVAQIRGNKAFFWIIYCAILGIMSLVELAVGGSALSKSSNNMNGIRTQLQQNVMETYWRDPDFHKPNHTDRRSDEQKAWDETQIKYECCGLNNYTDWQTVQFGRTSLSVPTSCCIEATREDEWCGINLLPVHPNASEIINEEGCFLKIITNVKFQLHVMGYFGLIVSIFQFGIVGIVSYLLISKKI